MDIFQRLEGQGLSPLRMLHPEVAHGQPVGIRQRGSFLQLDKDVHPLRESPKFIFYFVPQIRIPTCQYLKLYMTLAGHFQYRRYLIIFFIEFTGDLFSYSRCFTEQLLRNRL